MLLGLAAIDLSVVGVGQHSDTKSTLDKPAIVRVDWQWRTEGMEAVVQEAEAMFKAISRGDKELCETSRLRNAIHANRCPAGGIAYHDLYGCLFCYASSWRVAEGGWLACCIR